MNLYSVRSVIPEQLCHALDPNYSIVDIVYPSRSLASSRFLDLFILPFWFCLPFVSNFIFYSNCLLPSSWKTYRFIPKIIAQMQRVSSLPTRRFCVVSFQITVISPLQIRHFQTNALNGTSRISRSTMHSKAYSRLGVFAWSPTGVESKVSSFRYYEEFIYVAK